ncbi:MAG: hypothetical protein WAL25_00220 [Acidimicrobiia bacterium]
MNIRQRVFAWLAWIYVAAVGVQFALAGLGLPQLGGQGMAAHIEFGYMGLSMTPILLVISSIVARAGRKATTLTVLLTVFAFVQPIWVASFKGRWPAALHILGAGAILTLSLAIAMLATRQGPLNLDQVETEESVRAVPAP